LKLNYKMLTVGLVMVAILVTFLATSVMAAPDNRYTIGDSKIIAYDAQNGCGQQNCQGTCDGNCDQNKGKGSGQCDGTCNNGRQGPATRGNNRSCNGSCTGK
jgi:hypothetical protein